MPSKKKASPAKYQFKGTYAKETRAFRTQVATLKKRGLLPASIDARKITRSNAPASVKAALTKYGDVATEYATTVKVKPAELEQFKKAGYRTAKGRVIVEKMPEQKLVGKQGMNLKFKSTGTDGLTRILVNVPYQDLESWFEKMIDRAEDFPLPDEETYFGFRFFGNPSITPYQTPQEALMQLRGYISVQRAINDGTRADQRETYRNIEILMYNENDFDWRDLPRPKRTGGPNSGTKRPGGAKKFKKKYGASYGRQTKNLRSRR